MTAHGYCRISKKKEGGLSLDAQERKIRSYCELHDLDVPQIYVDPDDSGDVHMHKRPEGKRLLAAIRPGDSLVVTTFDRAFRSALDAHTIREDFKNRGIQLVFIDIGEVTKSAHGVMIFSVMAGLAQAERERACERNTFIREDEKARGRYTGGKVPFGFTLGEEGQLVAQEDQQTALATARALARDGVTTRAIARRLNAQGFKISHVTLGKYL